MKISWSSNFSVYNALTFTGKIWENVFSLPFYKYLHNILNFTCLPAKSQIRTIWPFTQKACWPLSGSIHSALESKALRGSQQSECCHTTQGLNLCRDSTGEMFYIQKRLRLGHRKDRRIHLASVRMGTTQTEVRCIDIKLTVEGSSSPVPSVMRCDPDMMRPCVQSQFSPHSTQHCLFHCRLPFITEQ